MKRFWIGAVLLAGLVILGGWSSRAMDGSYSEISGILRQSGQAAARGDWSGADQLAAQAWQSWEKSRSLGAALTDHTALDEMDGTFAELEVYRRQRQAAHYAAACARLASRAQALAESHRFSWKNIL